MTNKLEWTGASLLFVFAALAACGGGGSSAAPTANTVPRFAYVANNEDNTVSGYTVNATTGQLRHNGYALTGTSPQSVAIDPSGKFVYLANYGSADVSAYTISAGGALTPVAGHPLQRGPIPTPLRSIPRARSSTWRISGPRIFRPTRSTPRPAP